MIYWLDTKGASIVAGLRGQSVKQLKWRKKPRYSLIEHDLRINDFRIAIREACRYQESIELRSWVPESEFASRSDRIKFEASSGKIATRSLRPDGYFVIERKHRFGRTKPFAFLLEIDMGTEDNLRFAREKIRPGVAYLKSDEYARRFGTRHGRFLIITTGQRRMLNMKEQAERHGGKGLFYFSTFDAMQTNSIITEQVWFLAGYEEARCIIPR